MTLDSNELQALAVQVRGLVDKVAALFGAGPGDGRSAVDAPALEENTEGASTYDGWSHLVRVPVPADAVDRLDGPVRDLLVGEGFEEVDRSSDTEIARQFRATPAAGIRADVGVQIARSGRGDVVIGASADSA
ncbi:hypothetical protein ACXR2U_13510 [Jatrophihabitans sp. YIM 134969]